LAVAVVGLVLQVVPVEEVEVLGCCRAMVVVSTSVVAAPPLPQEELGQVQVQAQ
jgi:hypothetical protein